MKARSIFHSLRHSNFEICIHIYIYIHLNVDMIKYLSTACPSQSSFCLSMGIDYRDRKLKIIYSAMGCTLLCTLGLHEFRSVYYLSMYMFCYDIGNITLMSVWGLSAHVFRPPSLNNSKCINITNRICVKTKCYFRTREGTCECQ